MHALHVLIMMNIYNVHAYACHNKQDKIQLSEDALLTMKRELQDKVKELSTMVIDHESLESSLAMSERRNLELYEQATEAQQEVRRVHAWLQI